MIRVIALIILLSSTAFASDIGTRIRDDPSFNYSDFTTIMLAYLTGDINATVAETWMNNRIDDNQGSPITTAERSDAVAIKNKYDALATTDDKQFFLLKLITYTQQLSSSNISMSQWDTFFVDP